MLQENLSSSAIKASRPETSVSVLPRALEFISIVSSQARKELSIPDLQLISLMVQEFPAQRPSAVMALSHESLTLQLKLEDVPDVGIAIIKGKTTGLLPEQGTLAPGSVSTSLGDRFQECTPRIVQVAMAAAPVLQHVVPGDVTAFEEAVWQLRGHQENILCHYVLAIAKYPTIVRQLANLFKDLPAIITPAALKSACHKAIIFAHEANDKPALQQ